MGWTNSKVMVLITTNAALITSMFIWSIYVFSRPPCPPPSLLSPCPIADCLSKKAANSSESLSSSLSSQQSMVEAKNLLTSPMLDVPLHTKDLPPLEAFRLTKGLLQRVAKGNIVIVTFGNSACADIILNWVKHLTDHGLSNFLVGAMDTKLLGFLYLRGIPVFNMTGNLGVGDIGWGSSRFHKIGRSKVVLLESVLTFGYELLLSDTDVAWLKDPRPYFSRYPEADLLLSTDQIAPTVSDDMLEIWHQVDAD